jgi:hypothetical protein
MKKKNILAMQNRKLIYTGVWGLADRVRTLLILFVSGIFIILISQSCCDCPLNPERTTTIPCNVREATITQFNPGQVKVNDSTIIPVAEYSIHTFQFPSDKSSSGTTPNDDRYTNGRSQVVIAQRPFSDHTPYYVAIMDEFPTNADMKGDILVDSIFYTAIVADRYALIRFGGYLTKLNANPFNVPPFTSDNANDFCNKIRDTISKMPNNMLDKMRDSAKNHQYGEGITGAINYANYNSAPYTVLNSSFATVTDPNIIPSDPDIQAVRDSANKKKVIAVEVRIGDMFYYIAKNGKAFIVTVVDIRDGTLPPFKKRLSLMFNPVD